jgi:hypothetical protein
MCDCGAGCRTRCADYELNDSAAKGLDHQFHSYRSRLSSKLSGLLR